MAGLVCDIYHSTGGTNWHRVQTWSIERLLKISSSFHGTILVRNQEDKDTLEGYCLVLGYRPADILVGPDPEVRYNDKAGNRLTSCVRLVEYDDELDV